MKLIKYSAKLYFKNIFLSVLTALFFCSTHIFIAAKFIQHMKFNSFPLSYLGNIINISVFFFVFFLFVSFEYFSKIRSSGFEECVDTTQKGKGALFFSQFAVMGLLAVVLTLTITAMNVIVYFVLKINKTEYLWHILGNMVLNVFLVSIVAIVFGILFSQIKKKLAGYLCLTLLVILASPVASGIANGIIMSFGPNFFPFTDFFAIVPFNDTFYVASFGFSLLPLQFARIGFWLFASTALILLTGVLLKRKARVVAGLLCVALSVGCGVAYFQPGSNFRMDDSPTEGVFANQYYYLDEKKEVLDVPADFHAKEYDLDFEIGNQLSAKVSVTVDKTDLQEYRFTLFHGYLVKSVENEQGLPLDFQQNSDYLTVKNSEMNEKIVVEYAGKGFKYHSNWQGTMLPGFFPYYPVPGFHPVYNTQKQGLLKIYPADVADFNLRVKSSKKIFTNLEEQSDGSFQGTTDAVTIMSGMLEEIKVGDRRVVYPYLDTQNTSLEIINDVINNFLNKVDAQNKYKAVFIFPSMNGNLYERACAYDDHITTSSILGLKSDFELQSINPRKISFYLDVESYQRDSEMFAQRTEEMKKYKETDMVTFRIMMLEKASVLGKEAFVEKCWEYLKDDNDARTSREFLNQLK